MPRKGKRRGGKTPSEPRVRPERDAFVSGEELKNDNFNEYYKQQQILPPEEFPEFLSFLQKTLPISWRITGNRQ
jgi:multisite-specific tRNA:(cytosine-C5)-methyltransferase